MRRRTINTAITGGLLGAIAGLYFVARRRQPSFHMGRGIRIGGTPGRVLSNVAYKVQDLVKR